MTNPNTDVTTQDTTDVNPNIDVTTQDTTDLTTQDTTDLTTTQDTTDLTTQDTTDLTTQVKSQKPVKPVKQSKSVSPTETQELEKKVKTEEVEIQKLEKQVQKDKVEIKKDQTLIGKLKSSVANFQSQIKSLKIQIAELKRKTVNKVCSGVKGSTRGSKGKRSPIITFEGADIKIILLIALLILSISKAKTILTFKENLSTWVYISYVVCDVISLLLLFGCALAVPNPYVLLAAVCFGLLAYSIVYFAAYLQWTTLTVSQVFQLMKTDAITSILAIILVYIMKSFLKGKGKPGKPLKIYASYLFPVVIFFLIKFSIDQHNWITSLRALSSNTSVFYSMYFFIVLSIICTVLGILSSRFALLLFGVFFNLLGTAIIELSSMNSEPPATLSQIQTIIQQMNYENVYYGIALFIFYIIWHK